MPPSPIVNHLVRTVRGGSRGAPRGPLEQLRKPGGHMATLSLEHAARLTGQGKAILARAISGRLFTGTKENGGYKIDGAAMGPTYPLPAPVETRGEVRSRPAPAEGGLAG